MTVLSMREEMAELDREYSRVLALEIGSALTAEPDRGDPDAVLVNTLPVRDWLLGGPDDESDRINRRRAARRHLENLKDAAAASQGRRVNGIAGSELFTWPGPAGFMTVAGRYYAMLTGGGDC
jgi:hypothetical protein